MKEQLKEFALLVLPKKYHQHITTPHSTSTAVVSEETTTTIRIKMEEIKPQLPQDAISGGSPRMHSTFSMPLKIRRL